MVQWPVACSQLGTRTYGGNTRKAAGALTTARNRRPPLSLRASLPSSGGTAGLMPRKHVIEPKHHHGAQDRYKQAPHVESCHTGRAERREDPASDERADD